MKTVRLWGRRRIIKVDVVENNSQNTSVEATLSWKLIYFGVKR